MTTTASNAKLDEATRQLRLARESGDARVYAAAKSQLEWARRSRPRRLDVKKIRAAEAEPKEHAAMFCKTGGTMGVLTHDGVRVTRIGRNDLCVCGSGSKFKHCCGR